MIVVDCEQGDEVWHESRVAVTTASNFSECRKIMASGKNKGQHSSKAKEYAFKLAIERISGQRLSEDKFETFEMRRGRELEPEARILHEGKKEILVRRTGIALTDDRKFGASVDGLIDHDGISEYKCFIAPSSLMPILLENDIESIKDQIQGGLWITNREYCHFCLYCPGLRSIDRHLTIIEMERDDDYIEEMIEDLMRFDRLTCSYIERLKQAA